MRASIVCGSALRTHVSGSVKLLVLLAFHGIELQHPNER